MSLAVAPPKTKLMTCEEFLELPEIDGIDRELINGEIRERPMTLRNHTHAETETNIAYVLKSWLQSSPDQTGRISSGEVGFRLKQDPATFVGVDVAFASRELFERTVAQGLRYYDGAPILAVEILSPSDKHEDISDKVKLYLEVGTVLWVVDPDIQTVIIYRSGHSPQILDRVQELSGEPYLPGFRVPVAAFFE